MLIIAVPKKQPGVVVSKSCDCLVSRLATKKSLMTENELTKSTGSECEEHGGQNCREKIDPTLSWSALS